MMVQSGFFSRMPPTRRRSIAESSTTRSVAILNVLVCRCGEGSARRPGDRKGPSLGENAIQLRTQPRERTGGGREVALAAHFLELSGRVAAARDAERPECPLDGVGAPPGQRSVRNGDRAFQLPQQSRALLQEAFDHAL